MWSTELYDFTPYSNSDHNGSIYDYFFLNVMLLLIYCNNVPYITVHTDVSLGHNSRQYNNFLYEIDLSILNKGIGFTCGRYEF